MQHEKREKLRKIVSGSKFQKINKNAGTSVIQIYPILADKDNYIGKKKRDAIL